MSQEIKYTEDMVGNFRILGFATGSYNCTCMSEKSSHCAKHFIGDKRAFMCLACAIEAVEEKFMPCPGTDVCCISSGSCSNCIRSAADYVDNFSLQPARKNK
jgi:hypothetical protein